MKSRNIKGLQLAVMICLLLLGSSVSAGEWVNPGLLVDAETVAKNIDKPNWVVIDSRDLKDYLKGHIPGAINLGKRAKSALRDSTSRAFRDISKYEALLGKAGIDNDTHVVFYHGDLKTLTDASVGFWLLEYLGHDKVYMLDGGIDAWRKAGKRLDKKPIMKAPKTFTAKVVPSRYATTDEILEIANGKSAGVQLIDSRTKKEHIGKDIRAVKGGHIPNTTINVSHLDTLIKIKDPKTGKKKAIAYLDPEALTKHFAGLDKNKRTVAYCQTGTRSTLTYLQLRLLGFKDAANWDESWRVWASNLHADYPIDAPNGPQYYNFAKVNKTLKKLEKKVAALEKQLAPAKKK